MTSITNGPPAPAWYRRLPKPPNEHNPSLHRASLLSQHHIFHGRPANYDAGEDTSRRTTSSVAEIHRPLDRAEVVERRSESNASSRSASPSKRAGSLVMAEDKPEPEAPASGPNAREHLCLCPSEPKIPRPRNCEHAPSPTATVLYSVNSVAH